nr:MAG TPA: hypothetical protein [Caudoviricetes sp.]
MVCSLYRRESFAVLQNPADCVGIRLDDIHHDVGLDVVCKNGLVRRVCIIIAGEHRAVCFCRCKANTARVNPCDSCYAFFKPFGVWLLCNIVHAILLFCYQPPPLGYSNSLYPPMRPSGSSQTWVTQLFRHHTAPRLFISRTLFLRINCPPLWPQLVCT